MTEQQSEYLAYLLRLWRCSDKEKTVWRASLQNSQTRERVGFASLDDLFHYLREYTNAVSVENGQKGGEHR